MALNSINTNIAAYSAQRNIGTASDNAASSIARLSSGNKIVRASDDVAALSTGTSLRTSVTTLRQAMLNTAQGSSLLQIADGALGQVVDILQRQKALAVQAGSGSLSDTDRSFLDQEFQALKNEIDRIATSTKFSSVTLLNGTLSGSEPLLSNSQDGISTSVATVGNVFSFTAAPADGSTIIVNGVTVTFTTSPVGSADAAGKVVVAGTTAQRAANLAAFLNESTDARLANLNFVATGANISARWTGGQLSGPYTVNASLGTATGITLGSVAARTINIGVSADGLGVDRTQALGAVTGSVLTNGGAAATDFGAAINTSLIEDNADFIGKIGQGKIGLITGVPTTAQEASFQLKVGDITYTAPSTDIVNAAVVPLVFTGADQFGNPVGGSFTLNLRGNLFTAAAQVDSQSEIDQLTAQINESLRGITFTQNRDITSFQEGAIVTVNSVQVANLDNISVNFRSDNFTSVNIETIDVKAPAVGSSDATITVQINGETYTSYSGIGSRLDINSSIVLVNTTNPNRAITLHTGNVPIAGSTTIAMDLSSQANADAVKNALRTAFGIDENSSKLSFQVGNTSEESLGVQIDSVQTADIYRGRTLSVATQAGASAASTAIDEAINIVVAVRADVGALQSRFNFAATNLQVTVQNQDDARGVLLDTDVTEESTAYATSQVQLQAGISVLAQANLLPQNLLKLIGG